MASDLTELSAANSENYPQNPLKPQKLADSKIVTTPEVYATKHQIIDIDDSQQKESSTDAQELHF